MAEQVVPSRMNLALYRAKIVSAKKGHKLLKKKCDTLKLSSEQKWLLDHMKHYYQSQKPNMQQLKYKVCCKESHYQIRNPSENIAGFMLPEVNIREIDGFNSSKNPIGLARGGQSIQRCRDKFKDQLVLLKKLLHIKLFLPLQIKLSKQRIEKVNALEYVVIPRFTATMNLY